MPHFPDTIVDAHHHLWRLSAGHYPWLQDHYDPHAFFLGDYTVLRQDFGAGDYTARWQRIHVAATVHVEAERDRAESLAETAWLHQHHARYSFPNAIVVYTDLLRDDHAEHLRAQLQYPLVRGVRCKPRIAADPDQDVRHEPGALQDARWQAGLEALARNGLSWDLRVPYWHLEEAALLIGTIPNLKVVVEHTGLPWDRTDVGLSRWLQGMRALASLPNVYLKLSEFGLPDRGWDRVDNVKVIQLAIDVFGPHRCMFASNLPVSGLRADVSEIIATMTQALDGLSEQQARGIWRDNALAFYRIALDDAPVPANGGGHSATAHLGGEA